MKQFQERHDVFYSSKSSLDSQIELDAADHNQIEVEPLPMLYDVRSIHDKKLPQAVLKNKLIIPKREK